MKRGLRSSHIWPLLSTGPSAIRLLLNQLNATGDKEDGVRVREMVRDMNEIDGIVRSKGFPVSTDAKFSFDLETEWNSLGLGDAVQDRMKRVRATFERFKLRLRPVCPLENGWKFHMMTPWSGDPKKRGLILWTFLSIIHDLALEGRLTQVRECNFCHRWFFGRRNDQGFCSPSCREKDWRTSPRGRTKRAAYMRRYRQREEQRNQNALKTAKDLRREGRRSYRK